MFCHVPTNDRGERPPQAGRSCKSADRHDEAQLEPSTARFRLVRDRLRGDHVCPEGGGSKRGDAHGTNPKAGARGDTPKMEALYASSFLTAPKFFLAVESRGVSDCQVLIAPLVVASYTCFSENGFSPPSG